ncbi:MAG: glycosyltransferase family 39 protein [Defluviimonas denitrificans]
MAETSRRDTFWLAAILALAAVLRIWGLNAPLWHDEIHTVVTHLDLPWGDMLRDYSMNHHYLHNIAAKATMELFGREPWAIRLPAMLFGLGVIWATWVLAREMAGVTIAHVTALLLALSYHEIWFSQNARGYTGLALFSTLGMLYFLRGLRTPATGTWVAFGVTLAAAVFTHLTGAFFFMAQGVVWLGLILWRLARGRLDGALVKLPLMGFVIGGVLTILLYLPILPSLLATVSNVSETSAVDVMKEYQNPVWTAMEAIRTGIGQSGALVAVTGLAVLALVGLGSLSLRRREPLFAPITVLHILLTVALLMAVGMRIWPRFFFVDIGFLVLLIVLGGRFFCDLIGRMTGSAALGRGLFILGTVGVVAISAYLAKRNYDFPKQDTAGAYAYVTGIQQPGERVLAVGHTGPDLNSWYKAGWPEIYTDDEYRAALAEPGPVILVVGFPARSFRDVPALGADAGYDDGTDMCDPDRVTDLPLKVLRCFSGTLGDGGMVVLRRD